MSPLSQDPLALCQAGAPTFVLPCGDVSAVLFPKAHLGAVIQREEGGIRPHMEQVREGTTPSWSDCQHL